MKVKLIRPLDMMILQKEGTSGEPQEKSVQEAMNTLLDNEICKQPVRGDHKANKLFSDTIEGKKERFCGTRLGKQVDC